MDIERTRLGLSLLAAGFGNFTEKAVSTLNLPSPLFLDRQIPPTHTY